MWRPPPGAGVGFCPLLPSRAPGEGAVARLLPTLMPLLWARTQRREGRRAQQRVILLAMTHS